MRVSPASVSHNAPLLSPKEEQNDMKKQEKPREEQMSEKMFHLGGLS